MKPNIIKLKYSLIFHLAGLFLFSTSFLNHMNENDDEKKYDAAIYRFESSFKNDILAGEGFVTMRDGSTQRGYIQFSALYPSSLLFSSEDSMEFSNLTITNVSYFTCKQLLFYGVSEKMQSGLRIGKIGIDLSPNSSDGAFMGLLSDSFSKAALFVKFAYKENSNSPGNFYLDKNHYAYFKNYTNSGVRSISSGELTPISKKVPALVSDCPELRKQIESEAVGYKKTGGVLNPKTHIPFLRIINEYNACK